ncbi:MAG: ADOP family duplicated permease [Cyanobacteria bacterium]|nr:ADOP family duplicated permease [Cyanobacteriota bacterium]
MRDVRDAVRSVSRTPGFAAVVVLTLGLGIGAAVTTYSVMEAVLWRPLPYPDADRLLLLDATLKNRKNSGIAPFEARELRARAKTIDRIAAVSGVSANLNIDGELERVFAASANDDALRILGAEPPVLGRLTRDREDIGADGYISAVAISDALWRRHFGADPSAIGRRIQVNNIDAQIVGVLRPGLKVFLPAMSNAAEEIDVWFPRGDSDRLDVRDPATIARLAPGVTIAEAQAELDTFARAFAADRPGAYAGGFALLASPLQDLLTERVKPALMALGAAVAFVLLISCVNVTNLMLARAKTREREIAVRSALGAKRGRLIAQMLAESIVLAGGGAALGLAIGAGGIALLDWLRPTHLPRQSQIAIDSGVAIFAIGIAALVCLVFGLVPAFRATRREHTDPLRSGRAGTTAGGLRRLQRALVVAEVALSIVPLVGGGLMIRSFWNLAHAPIGFDPSEIVTARVQMSFRAFPDLEQRRALIQNAIEQVRQLPGVEDVSAGTSLPFTLPNTRRFARDGDPSSELMASQQAIAPGYLSLTRTRLVEGRDVTGDDIRQNRLVAIVDQRIAQRLWPDGAVGRFLAIQIGSKPAKLEVIGVTEPVRATRVNDAEMPHVFLSYNVQQGEPYLVIRTRQSAAILAPQIRRVVEALGTLRAVVDIRPMRDYVDLSVGDTRFTMLMLTAFAAASLLLAGVGMYGTLAYLISRRTQEFGIRMALGASAATVMRMVAAEGALLAAIGAGAGLAVALGVAGGLRTLLYGVAPLDLTTVAVVATLMAIVAVAAASLPAWRASRVDPTIALRAE